MNEYRDNLGAIYQNKNKVNGDNLPNLTGKGRFEGKQFWVYGFTKIGPDGEKFISLQFRTVEGGRTPPPSVDLTDD